MYIYLFWFFFYHNWHLVEIKGGIWKILKTTLIFKATHKFNLDFKSTLKSTLISKRELLHIFKTTLISRQLEFSLVNDIHNVSILSSEEGLWILFSGTILLLHHWGIDCLCEDFQISMLYLLTKKLLCALIWSSVITVLSNHCERRLALA